MINKIKENIETIKIIGAFIVLLIIAPSYYAHIGESMFFIASRIANLF